MDIQYIYYIVMNSIIRIEGFDIYYFIYCILQYNTTGTTALYYATGTGTNFKYSRTGTGNSKTK